MTQSRFFSSRSATHQGAETFSRGLVGFMFAAAATLTLAGLLAFFWAPQDADQGIRQNIFYLHML